MGNLWVPRVCAQCGARFRKLKTNRTLFVAGRGAIPDYGMYFTDCDGKVTDVFGFYKCEQCGALAIFEMEDVKR